MGDSYWSGSESSSATYEMCDLGKLLCLSVPHFLHLKMGRTVPYGVGIGIRQCIYKVFRIISAYTKTSKFLFFCDLPPGVGECGERGALPLGIQAIAVELQPLCT